MSIRKRKWTSGGVEKTAWVFDYFDHDGKRHIVTRDTKREAEAERDRIRPEIKQGVHVHHRDGMTVGEAAEEWLRQCEAGRDGEHPVEPHTLRQYENHVTHIKALIGADRISQLTEPKLKTFRDNLLARSQLERAPREGAPETKPKVMPKISRATAKKILTSFKSILMAGGANAAVMHIGRKIKIKADEGRRAKQVEIPEPADVGKILATADGEASQANKQRSKRWRRWRAFLYTAALSGMRQSELRGLEWPHIEFRKREITVSQRADELGTIGPVKSEAARRTIPLPSALATVLKEWKLECPKPEEGAPALVFPNWQGRVESGANIHSRAWVAILDRAKLKRTNFHTLRHFHASQLIGDGANPKEVQTEMGHSSIQVTYDLYGHLFKADLPARKRRADRLAAALITG